MNVSLNLDDAIRVLASNPPPPAKPRTFASVAEGNNRIYELETQLGANHRPPMFNAVKIGRRVEQLEGLLAQKNAAAGIAPKAATVSPEIVRAVPPIAQAAPAIPATVEAAAGALVATLAKFKGMDAATRAQFQQEGGALCRSDFEALPAAARMAHCKAGGKVIDAPGTVARRYAPGVVEAGAPMERTGEFARNGTALTRAEFDKLKPAGQMQFMRAGGKLTD
jgi:hypothetical protein